AVVTEALSNAVGHSGASEITVSVSVGDDLTIMVTDNGKGIPADNRRSSGLRNLARRAESAGGIFTVSNAETGGTKLVWKAPLTAE
ncbi:MAG: histidine kinase, partial [Mycolicibacterium aromaticivorans]|nr:histidine kinase [Mycolicibacterium aromaticivorans]